MDCRGWCGGQKVRVGRIDRADWSERTDVLYYGFRSAAFCISIWNWLVIITSRASSPVFPGFMRTPPHLPSELQLPLHQPHCYCSSNHRYSISSTNSTTIQHSLSTHYLCNYSSNYHQSRTCIHNVPTTRYRVSQSQSPINQPTKPMRKKQETRKQTQTQAPCRKIPVTPLRKSIQHNHVTK